MQKYCASLLLSLTILLSPALAKDDDSKDAASEGGKPAQKQEQKQKEKKSDSKKPVAADKKRVLVEQIIETVKANKPNPEEKAALKKKRHERIEHLVDVYADQAKLDDEARAKLKAKFSNHENKPKKEMPPELKQKLEATFGDRKEFCREMTYQVLADHFDEKDLKEISRFLKSPTGVKLIKNWKDMLGQAISMTIEHYMPALVDVTQKLKNFAPPSLNGMPGLPGFPGMPNFNGGGNPMQRPEMMDKFKQMFEQMQKQRQMPNPKEQT